jgi:hypothetical protein
VLLSALLSALLSVLTDEVHVHQIVEANLQREKPERKDGKRSGVREE